MESFVRNVRDLDAGNRQSLETILGRRLGDDQQVMIRVVTPVEPVVAEHGTLSDLIGAWKTDHVPTDDEIERILEEERIRKHA